MYSWHCLLLPSQIKTINCHIWCPHCRYVTISRQPPWPFDSGNDGLLGVNWKDSTGRVSGQVSAMSCRATSTGRVIIFFICLIWYRFLTSFRVCVWPIIKCTFFLHNLYPYLLVHPKCVVMKLGSMRVAVAVYAILKHGKWLQWYAIFLLLLYRSWLVYKQLLCIQPDIIMMLESLYFLVSDVICSAVCSWWWGFLSFVYQRETLSKYMSELVHELEQKRSVGLIVKLYSATHCEFLYDHI